MNYKLIHENIISRALNRDIEEYTESHHIIPKCEGGCPNGPTVKLTPKEHRIVHLLRYKFTGVVGNLYAYYMLKNKNRQQNSVIAAKISHIVLREKHPEKYHERQQRAGIKGGRSSFINKKGFYDLSQEELNLARDKGRKYTIENKLGMFSDEYREKHKEILRKKVLTPDGVFDSMGQAAEYYNVSNATITYRVKSDSNKFTSWKIVEKDNEYVTN